MEFANSTSEKLLSSMTVVINSILDKVLSTIVKAYLSENVGLREYQTELN